MLPLSICLSCLCVIAFGKSVIEKRPSEEPLNLSPLIENGEAVKARNMSAVDPTLFAGLKSHSAFINVNKTGKWNLFFWFFPAEGLPLESTPWIIWLQGGPGASSLFGLFEEIGPLQYVDGKVQKMPITWASNYSLLFIDNPIDAGFSYVEDGGDNNIYNEDQVGASLLNFIQQFLEVFPELRLAPLFIAGESYAGKYIPAFGHYIHTRNKNDSLPINLKGLSIGDGWIDPPSSLHYTDMILQLGLADINKAKMLDKYEKLARKFWDQGNIEEYKDVALVALNKMMEITKDINVYNIITDGSINEHYTEFLSQATIKSALHVGNRTFHDVFVSGKHPYQNYLNDDFLMSVKPWLEELLEHYGVMCYNGQLDLLVGYAASLNLYRSLKWSGQQNYLQAERMPIQMPKDVKDVLNIIGYVKGYGNFMEVLVRAAGHMVPQDQPRPAKYIIDMFINKFK